MTSTCPGCGLAMPTREGLTAHGYYHASPECWSVYSEVLGAEYSNAVIFGQVHQLTVDAYAAQHAGGEHPDKSVDVHLVGLHLVLDRAIAPTSVPPILQRIASLPDLPHYDLPPSRASLTIFDVAMAADAIEHVALSRKWSAEVWQTWSHVHAQVRALAESVL